MRRVDLEANNCLYYEEPSFVLISFCTYKRTDVLSLVMDKIKELILPSNIRVEVLVVDNCPEASAFDIIEKLKIDFPININYFNEKKTGLCFARNRLLKEAVKLGATHIALFDDDGLLEQNWLVKHLETYKKTKAQIISGPQYTWFDKEYPKYLMNNNIFKINTTKKWGQELKSCATNNVFLATEIYHSNNIYFDEMYVFMGGEDGDFFKKLTDLGYKIVFNPESIIYEITNETRCNLKWVISRSYYNGYSRALLKFKYNSNFIKRFFYVFKLIFVLFGDICLVPFSVLKGKTGLLNAVCICIKNFGKMCGCIKNKPLNYYKQKTKKDKMSQ